MGLPITDFKIGDVHNPDGKCACCITREVEEDGNIKDDSQGLGNCHCGCCPCVPEGNLKFEMIKCSVLKQVPNPAWEAGDGEGGPPPQGTKFTIDKWEDCTCKAQMLFDMTKDDGVACNKTKVFATRGGGQLNPTHQRDGIDLGGIYGERLLVAGAPMGDVHVGGAGGPVTNLNQYINPSFSPQTMSWGGGFLCGGSEYTEKGNLWWASQLNGEPAQQGFQEVDPFVADSDYVEAWGAEITDWCKGCQSTAGEDNQLYTIPDPDNDFSFGEPPRPMVWEGTEGSFEPECAGMSIIASLCCCKTGIPQTQISLQNQYQPQYNDDKPDGKKGNHPCLISDNTVRDCSNCFFRNTPPSTTWRELFMITADMKEDENGELEPDTKQKDYYEGGGQKHDLLITWSVVQGRAKPTNPGGGEMAGTVVEPPCGGVIEAMNSSDDNVWLGQKLNPDQYGGNHSQELDQAAFVGDIEAAFEIWEKTFNWLYPWLNLKFSKVGSPAPREANRTHIKLATYTPRYPLDAIPANPPAEQGESEIGDIRIALAPFQCSDGNSPAAGYAYYPDSWATGGQMGPVGGFDNLNEKIAERDEKCAEAAQLMDEHCPIDPNLQAQIDALQEDLDELYDVEQPAAIAALEAAKDALDANTLLITDTQTNLALANADVGNCLDVVPVCPDLANLETIANNYQTALTALQTETPALLATLTAAAIADQEVQDEIDALEDDMNILNNDPRIQACNEAQAALVLCQVLVQQVESLENEDNWVLQYTGSELGKWGTAAGDIILSNYDTFMPHTRSTYWRWRKDGTDDDPSMRDCPKTIPHEDHPDGLPNGKCPDGYTNAYGKGWQCNINIKRTMLYLIGIAMGIPRNKDPNFPELSIWGPEDCRAVMYRATTVNAGENDGKDLIAGCAGKDGELKGAVSTAFPVGRGGEWCKDVTEQWPGIDGPYGFASITSEVVNWRLWPDLWYICSQYGNAGRYATEDDLKDPGSCPAGSTGPGNFQVQNCQDYDRSYWPDESANDPDEADDIYYSPDGHGIPFPISPASTCQCNIDCMQFTIQPNPTNRHQYRIHNISNQEESLKLDIAQFLGWIAACESCVANPGNCVPPNGIDEGQCPNMILMWEAQVAQAQNALGKLNQTYQIWYSACSNCIDREHRQVNADDTRFDNSFNAGAAKGGTFSQGEFTDSYFQNQIIKGYCKGAGDKDRALHDPRPGTEFMLLVGGTWIMDCDCQLGEFNRRDKWRTPLFSDPNDNRYRNPSPVTMNWSGVITQA